MSITRPRISVLVSGALVAVVGAAACRPGGSSARDPVVGVAQSPLLAVSGSASQPAGAVSGDFDGDGKTDVMTLFDYGDATAGLLVVPGATGPGGTRQPYRVFYSGPGNFDVKHAKIAAGDFNHDGKTDVIALYDYGAAYGWAAAGLWIFPGTTGKTDGACVPYRAWFGGPGSFDVNAAKIAAGDFNHDGIADLIALYDYSVGYGPASAGLFVFPGTTATGDSASVPYQVWFTPAGNFDVGAATIAAGDFDNDGDADLLALYDYSAGYGWAAAGLWVFPGTPAKTSGASLPYRVWFGGAGTFDVRGTKVTAGDFNGDGKSDLLALYDYSVGYGPGSGGLFVVPGTTGKSDGSTGPYEIWFSGAGGFDVNRATVTAGNFVGDGKADVLALYEYGNGYGLGSAGMFVFPGTAATASGSTAPTLWADPGAFDFQTSDWARLGGSVISPVVPIRNADGTLQVFAIGSDHAMHTNQQATAGGGWAGWSSLGGSFAAFAPAAALDRDGRLELFAVGTDGALWHRAPATGAWSSFGKQLIDAPAIGQNADGRLAVFVVDSANRVSYRLQVDVKTAAWDASWTQLSGTVAVAHTPALARGVDGRLVLVIADTAGAVWGRSQYEPSGAWSPPWTSFAATTTQPPVLAQNGDGRMEAFIVGGDGRVAHRWQTTAGGAWAPDWKPMTPSAPVSQPIAVVRDFRDRLELIGVGGDGVPFYRVQGRDAAGAVLDDAWTNDLSLGGTLAGPATAALNVNGTVELFGRRSDQVAWYGFTVTPASEPDLLMQVRHPLTGCLSIDATDSLRQRLLSTFVDRYPNVDVRERCINGMHRFGVFIDPVADLVKGRAHVARAATLDAPSLLIDGADMAFHFDGPFILKYVRDQVGVPLHLDEDGNPSPDGRVFARDLTIEYAGQNVVITKVTGTIDAVLYTPSFQQTLTDQLFLVSPDNLKIPWCSSVKDPEIDSPGLLSWVPGLGQLMDAIYVLKLEPHNGQVPDEDGGVGCRLVKSLPRDPGIGLPPAFNTQKLMLEYQQPIAGPTGFTARAKLHVVPRQPLVRVICPNSPIGQGQCPSQVGGNNEQFQYLFGYEITDLHTPLKSVTWESDGNFADGDQVRVHFIGWGKDHYVKITVTDATDVTVTNTVWIDHPVPGGGPPP